MLVHPYGARTKGTLDLAGSSTQITFELGKKVELNTSVEPLSFYGYTYKIYTHSYQCYGQSELERQLQALLLKVPKPGQQMFLWGLSGGRGAFPSEINAFSSN